MQYRQGDVLIETVEAVPPDAKEATGPVILAEGEATGHAHKIKARHAKLYESAAGRFLTLARPARVVHEEHAPIALPAGNFRVTRQREYSPEAIRNVAD